MRARRGHAGLALLLAGALAVAGCSGSPGEDGPARKGAAATPSVPARPPLPTQVARVGQVTSPLVSPVWLVRSTGTDDSTKYDVESQGVFLAGDIAVYHALDTVLGVSTKDGKELWRNPVDTGGEEIRYAGVRGVDAKPASSPRWSYSYGLSRPHVVTLDVRTGKLVGDVEVRSVDAMASVGDEDYVATDRGIMHVTDEGELDLVTPVAALRSGKRASISEIAPVQGTTVAVLQTNIALVGPQVFAGVDLATGKVLWTKPASAVASAAGEGKLNVQPQDGRYVTWNEVIGSKLVLHLLVVDPQTGKIRRNVRRVQKNYYATDHFLQITSEDVGTGNQHGVTVVGDDVILNDYHGISRYSPLTDKFEWSLRDGQLATRHGGDSPVWSLGPLTADGKYVYASFATGNSGDVLLVDAASGKLVGRWGMDDKVNAGLTSSPLMVASGDKLLLARNQAAEGDPTNGFDEVEPLGELNDLGWFGFPGKS